MILAVLEGRKTQTRRVVKPQPELIPSDVPKAPGDNGWWWPAKAAQSMVQTRDMGAFCPYGQPGDRLWVREAWRAHVTRDNQPPREIPSSSCLLYEADNDKEKFPWAGKYRPPMFMPRWASRILLEIVAVRVERLNDISEADARAEGIIDGGCLNCGNSEPCGCSDPQPDARDSFIHLWESINLPGSWAVNPWVWVVEFKRVTP